MLDFSTPFFAVLCALYVLQSVFAYRLSGQKRRVTGSDGTEFVIPVRVATFFVNGGISNIWQFLILAVFVPVFFASLNSAVKLFKDADATALSFTHAYCLSTIIVLITLEFAYIHSLRQKIESWVSMLLVALALDFATLMVFIFAIGDPTTISQNGATANGEPSADSLGFGTTIMYLLVTTFFAFISTISTLLFAQTVAILADGKVDFPFRGGRQGESDGDNTTLGNDNLMKNDGENDCTPSVENAISKGKDVVREPGDNDDGLNTDPNGIRSDKVEKGG